MYQTKLIYGTLQRRGTCEKQGLCFCWIRSSYLERSVDKFSLIQWKTPIEFVFEFRYVIIDQLYDKFSITKPIKLDLSDRLQNQRLFYHQRLFSRVCVFAGYVLFVIFYIISINRVFAKSFKFMKNLSQICHKFRNVVPDFWTCGDYCKFIFKFWHMIIG